MRQREIPSPDLGDVLEVLLGDIRERSLEIGEVFFGETNDPAAIVGELVASPYIRARYRLGKNPGHRRHSFAAYAVPAAHCMAIGCDRMGRRERPQAPPHRPRAARPPARWPGRTT